MADNPIKTYQDVNKTDQNLSFGISRMEDIYSKRGGAPDDPHRHNFYTAILVLKARGDHYVDFNHYELTDHTAFFVSPGQVHQIIEHEKSIGFAMVFSVEFLIENNIPLDFIDDLNLFKDYGESPPLVLTKEQVSKLSALSEEMIQLNDSSFKYKMQALGSLLKLFLIHANNYCSQPTTNTHSIEAGNTILKNFKVLVNEKYMKWHGTSEYADALFITPDHLNRTVKSLIGKTAKEFIQSRITVAAKRMLCFTELSAKEIGYELGFSEPGNFSAFFKKCTDLSPSEFRSRI